MLLLSYINPEVTTNILYNYITNFTILLIEELLNIKSLKNKTR